MLTSHLIAVLISLLSSCCAASEIWTKYSSADYVAMACKGAVENATKFCPKVKKGYGCACKNKPELGSWLICAYEHTELFDEDVDQSIITLCAEAKPGMTAEKLHKQYQNATKYTVDTSTLKPKQISQSPIKGKKIEPLYQRYLHSFESRWGNYSISHYIGISFLAAMGGLMLIAGLINWTLYLIPIKKEPALVKSLKKYLILPAAFNRKETEQGRFGFIPGRLSSIWILGIFLFSLFSCAILGVTYHKGDPTFPNRSGGISRYYGDRSAILATYQLPLLFIFPGRNNIFQLITRWKYSRFLAFHKWLARIIIAELIVHAICFAIQSNAIGKTQSRMAQDYYREGIVAVVLGGLISIFSLSFLRNKFYEVFLYCHIVLVAMFLWTSFKHAQDQSYENYFWACAAIWVFDRFVRLINICQLGGPRKATVELIDDVLRVHVTTPHPIIKAFPGSHVFVYFMKPSVFWQSHPFTPVMLPSDPHSLTFFCKVKSGVTKRMAKYLEKCPDHEAELKVLLEGPYGVKRSYTHQSNFFFFATGTGFPGIFPQIMHAIHANPSANISVKWIIPDKSYVTIFGRELEHLKASNVKLSIFVTHAVDDTVDQLQTILDKESDSSSTLEKDQEDSISIGKGRPDLDTMVKNELTSAAGGLLIDCCAHPNVNDIIRSLVVKYYDECPGKVDLYDENQVW